MIIKLPAYALLEIGLLFTFAFMWAMDPLWRHTVGAALRRMADIGFSTGIPHVGSHPLGFLKSVDAAVVSWIERGKQGSERGVVYMFNQIVDAAALFVAIPLAIALALYELANYVVHHAAHSVTRVETHTIVKPIKTVVKVTTHTVTKVAGKAATSAKVVANTAVAIPGLTVKEWKDVRSRARSAKHWVDAHKANVGRLEKLLTAAGAIAFGLTLLRRLGLNWLRCPNVNKVGKSVCRMNPLALEALLLDAAALTVTFNLEEFAEELQTVTGEAARLIHNWSS